MNLQTQSLKHALKTILGMLLLAILAAAIVSSASITRTQAAQMGGGVKAAPATKAITSQGKLNHAVVETRLWQKPSVAKERVPCRRPHCNPWHDHTH
jgi:ascorbate-specific PTS system EIIC-type component UlaA